MWKQHNSHFGQRNGMFGKKGSMLTFDNTIWRIKTNRQKKPRETFKETSRSLIQEWVNKWPSSMLTRWRRWWCGVVMEGVSHPARNCSYLIFQYKGAKYLLHIPLYSSAAIISQPQTYATSIPKSEAMEYFKSIYHVCSVSICIEVQYLQTYSYTGNIPPNLWKYKQCVSKLNSTYYEPERQHNVRLHHASKVLYWQFIQVTCFSNAKQFSGSHLTIYVRNFGHHVPAVLLHRPQSSP
jgi:hypothetical protein